MIVARSFLIGCGLVLLGTAAMAFEQQQGATVPAPAAEQPAAAGASPNPVEMTAGQTPAAATGTEVRIPGLGKLGVLPKMDFGLELLYGAADGKTQPDPQTQHREPTAEELTIRGTVKHNF